MEIFTSVVLNVVFRGITGGYAVRMHAFAMRSQKCQKTTLLGFTLIYFVNFLHFLFQVFQSHLFFENTVLCEMF